MADLALTLTFICAGLAFIAFAVRAMSPPRNAADSKTQSCRADAISAALRKENIATPEEINTLQGELQEEVQGWHVQVAALRALPKFDEHSACPVCGGTDSTAGTESFFGERYRCSTGVCPSILIVLRRCVRCSYVRNELPLNVSERFSGTAYARAKDTTLQEEVIENVDA